MWLLVIHKGSATQAQYVHLHKSVYYTTTDFQTSTLIKNCAKRTFLPAAAIDLCGVFSVSVEVMCCADFCFGPLFPDVS